LDTANEIQGTSTEGQEELGFLGRFVNIFANPRKAFESIDRRPTWLWPLLIVVLLTAITTQIMFPVIMQAQMDRIRNNPNIPPEQLQAIEQQLSQAGAVQRITALVAQVVTTPLIYLIFAAIFYFVGSVLLGGDTTYKKVFAVFSWSSCISVLAIIVVMPLKMVKKSLTVSLSPALLLPGDSAGSKLHTLLSNFDFFTIWYLLVFAIGFSIIYKFSKAKAFTAVGILWAIWIAISVAFSGMLSQFGL
jgi:hypothetical protein